ncbi:MAG: DUF3309 domain-containing protein [Candidatus Omnitrophica bacterium]|nr:DUF3309 domain-containing protein [Candidatus Omnitrophota bacterium]
MSAETLIFVLVIVLLIGALPAWPHSRSWGYAPTSILTVLLAVFLIWAIAGDRPLFRSAGNDLKSIGRDAGDSIRRAVQ